MRAGGCKGQGALEHILVYWLAPISGVWSARWLQRLPTKDIPQSEKKKKLKSSWFLITLICVSFFASIACLLKKPYSISFIILKRDICYFIF